MTEEYIKEAYDKLRKKLGRQPGINEFYDKTNVTAWYLLKAGFRTYSQLVETMGDTPRTFSDNTKSKEEYYTSYGNLIRQIKQIPSTTDWTYNKCLPSVTNFKRKFNINKWSDMATEFFNYAKDKEEWADTIPLISIPKQIVQPTLVSEKEECFVYFMFDTKSLCYKIGISNEPDWREKTLQSEKPSIKLICAKKFVNRRIAANIEKALHDSYSHKRKRGEWFELDKEDIEEIKATLDN